MYQQINLYQPVFRRQRKVFSAATLLQITGVAAVVLLGFYAHARWTLNSLDTTESSLSTQYQQLESQLGILERGEGNGNLDVEDEVNRLQQSITQRQVLLASFARLDIRESTPFSEFFETLARRALPGLWLTGISLDEDGETELRGSTMNPTLVPHYLQTMPDQPRFTALHQGSVHLSRVDPDKSGIDFVLSSNTGGMP
ncbi:MAG: hypothetical protein KJO10_05300 [Gammaproteobacteria bacterium]|nr:hypothetical protein [Gammaproteobacteria bacterium]